MFKNAFVLLFLILLFSVSFSVRLVDPISKEVSNNDYVGSMSPNSELELIFSKEFGKFDEMEIISAPANFEIRKEDYLESFKVFITSNKNSLSGEYKLKLKFSGKESEEVSCYFLVEENLLDVSLPNYHKDVFVGNPAKYEISLINKSDAIVAFELTSNAPFYWKTFLNGEKSKKFVVPANTIKNIPVEFVPLTEGNHFFDIIASNPEEKVNLSVSLNAKQTFLGKINSPTFGFPFYSFSLIPSYYLNDLLSNIFWSYA